MPTPLRALALGCLAFATPLASPGSVDRVEPYTLQLGEDGRPLDGYFYLGFVHGLPPQAVHLGFNARQSSSRGSAPFHGEPLPEPSVRLDPHGLRYYSLGWGANSLAQAVGFARTKADRGATLSATEQRLAALPPAFDVEGKARPAASRRASLNLFDPATVGLLHDYARAHVKAWSAPVPHRATGDVIDRWGMDNEWEGAGGPDYSPEARAAFAKWLERAYEGDIAGLNEAWSARHADFSAAAGGRLPAPADYAAQPGAFLDWWTFQTEHFTATVAGIARVMHEADPLRRGVVHKSTQQTIEMPGVNRTHLFDHERFADLMRPVSGGLYGVDMYGSGDRQAYELNYVYNCIRPAYGAPGYGVFLPETNNHGGPANAFSATTWRMLANGLKAADFFTMGFAGAKNDWDKFGFIDPATGAPKGKLFYAGRWARMIHRTESFWTKSVPAPGMPRLMMLMPRRDVLLSPLSERTASRWSYPRNHRWMVFRWLREQGYWVDVVPYNRLTPENLAACSGLVLVGAAHLTGAETAAVSAYVRSGGILISDTSPAAFDEHHRARKAPLVPFASASGSGELALKLDGHSVVAQGAYPSALPAGVRVVATSADGKPAALLAASGKGRVLHFPFELGSLVLRQPGSAMPAFLAEGPTADSEEYIIPAGELAIGNWLGALLREAGLPPSYAASPALADSGNLRVEQPFVDAAGNVALVVATRADSAPRPLAAGTISVPLPGGPWTRALLAPAEHDGLVEVPVRAVAGGRHEITLPTLPTAGVVYLFRQHEPVLGIPQIASAERSADGFTARVAPGKAFSLTVQLFNTTGATLPAGTLRALVPAGWTVSALALTTPPLAPGASHTAALSVTPEADSTLLDPDWIYPLVVRWNDGRADRAVIGASVQVVPDPARHPLLLSGNKSYPATYPHRLDTGVTYRFETPAKGKVSDPAGKNSKTSGPALTNGFDAPTGTRSSGDPAWLAVVNDTAAEIVFDLKTPREIMRIVVTRGGRGPAPTRLAVVAGDPVHGYRTLAEHVPTGDALEYRLPALPGKVTELKLRVEWPTPGGSLDEVELWGR